MLLHIAAVPEQRDLNGDGAAAAAAARPELAQLLRYEVSHLLT